MKAFKCHFYNLIQFKRRKSIQLCSAFVLLFPLSVLPQESMLGDVSDGSRAVPVHLIKLYDEDGSVIRPNETHLLPFSTRETCGKCHD